MNWGSRALIRRGLAAAATTLTLWASSNAVALPIAFDKLPLGTPLAAMPKDIPWAISAKEAPSDVFKTSKMPYAAGDYYGVTLFQSAAALQAFSETGAVDTGDLANSGADCFYVAQATEDREPSRVREWELNQDRFVQVVTYPGYRHIAGVRRERLVPTGDAAKLEVTSYWVDTKTGGMRQWSRTDLDLLKVATPFDGVTIYAARTSETHVEVVASNSRGRIAKELFSTLGDDAGKAFATAGYPDMTVTGGELGRSACGHLRVALDLAPAAQPLPDVATTKLSKRRRFAMMQANLEVPSPAVIATPSTGLVNLVPLTSWERGPEGAHSRFGVLESFQTRPLRINLGLTQSNANQGSWLSVSYRWDGPPNLVRVVSLTDEQGGDQLVSVSD